MAPPPPAPTAATYRSLYRSILRSLRRSHPTSSPLHHYLRTTLLSTHAPSLPLQATAPHPTATLQNLATFLHNKAQHAALLELYNPTHHLSERERVRLTARRVGLDVPVEHREGAERVGPAAEAGGESLFRTGAREAQGQEERERRRREDMYSGKGDGVNRGGPLRPPGLGDVE